MNNERRDSPARVWVMRDEEEGGPLCCALLGAGLMPIHEPVIERRVVSDISGALSTLAEEDWLVLTSVFAIEHLPAGAWPCRIAVTGEASAHAARERGLRVELISDDGTGEGLWSMLRGQIAGAGRVLYPRSSLANPPREISNVRVESPVFYETVARPFDTGRIASAEVAAVTSPSTAQALKHLTLRPRCASIGPTTSAALRELGIEVWLESPAPTFQALATSIADALTQHMQHRR